MALTLDDKKKKARLNRSRALMSKINIIKAKYGSESPPIESQNDQDVFNSKMLFGQTGNENINWAMPGPEGLMRMYYRIIRNLNGTIRDNMVANGTTDAKSSSLNQAARWLTKGQGYLSAYFKSGKTDLQKMEGMQGKWNMSGTGFTDNIWRPNSWDLPPGFVYKLPHDTNCVEDLLKGIRTTCPTCKGTGTITSFIFQVTCPTCDGDKTIVQTDGIVTILGTKSPLGAKSCRSDNFSRSRYIKKGIMGERFTDIAPYDETYHPGSSGGGGGEDGEAEEPTPSYYSYTFGNGTYDYLESKDTLPIANVRLDYWNPAIASKVDSILNLLSDCLTFIQYTKVSNFTYMMNKKCIPGYSTQYSMQNQTINDLTGLVTRINNFKSFMNSHGGMTSSTTPSQYRSEINSQLDTFANDVNFIVSAVPNIVSQLEGSLGSPTTKNTLRYLRAETIKMIIDMNEGSRTVMEGIGLATTTMQSTVEKAEKEFELYDMATNEWIPTPEIVGIEQHMGLNKETFELEVDGYVVAWFGQDHCTAYDVWKSFDYDKDTGIGTWVKILPPGSTYTSQNIDINSGKVVSYIIDLDIDKTSGKSPYYKVKAYDNGGSGEYARTAATSLTSDPMSGEDFPVGGDQPAAAEVIPPPERIPQSELTSVRMPGGIYKWPTMLTGANAKDFERRIFESEVDYDKWGSNLTVYKNGLLVEQGEDQEYICLDNRRIQFHESVAEEDEIIIHVFFNIAEVLKEFEEGGSPGYSLQITLPYWKAPVAKSTLLPNLGNSEGDIRLVADEGKLYRWNGNSWSVITGGDSQDGTYWKEPVETFEDLPIYGNLDGDVRLVTTTGNLYRWDFGTNRWILLTDGTPFDQVTATVQGLDDLPSNASPGDLYFVSDENGYYQWVDPPGEWRIADNVGGSAAGAGVRYWKKPVNYKDELPINANSNGDVRLVINEKSLYQWESDSISWIKISGSDEGSSNWKSPVDLYENLPSQYNVNGDVRYVYETKKLYIWSASLQSWDPIKAEVDDIKHEDISDMPDEMGLVADHDGRYYTKSEFDQKYQEMLNRLNALNNLIPPDALNLSGNLKIKTNVLKTGFLSDGNNQTFSTLQPNKEYTKIFKSNSITLCNPDSTKYFRQGDKGELRVYINNQKVSTFNLASNFEESKRIYGQTYCPKTSEDSVIKILSVKPYNGFADYQICDFEITVQNNQLQQGENNIFVRHYLSSTEQYDTYSYILFYDTSSNSIIFSNVVLTQEALISTKYESGVRYYSHGDNLRLQFNVNNLFDNTYLDSNQVLIKTTDFAIPNRNIDLHSENVFGVTKGIVGDVLRYNEELTINMQEKYNIEPSVYLSGYRVFDKIEDVKFDFNFYINTRGQHSTDTKEYFKDEIYRLDEKNDFILIPKNIKNTWDSTRLLVPGQLQVFNSKLIYPYMNFTAGILPAQTANYSGYTGPRYYVRAFKSLSPKNNGVLNIPGFDRSTGKTLVEIKLPSITGWLSLNKYYNESDFTGVDGDGCLVQENLSAETFSWTSAQYSNVHSNFTIIVRIIMLDNTCSPIEGLFMTDWEEE